MFSEAENFCRNLHFLLLTETDGNGYNTLPRNRGHFPLHMFHQGEISYTQRPLEMKSLMYGTQNTYPYTVQSILKYTLQCKGVTRRRCLSVCLSVCPSVVQSPDFFPNTVLGSASGCYSYRLRYIFPFYAVFQKTKPLVSK